MSNITNNPHSELIQQLTKVGLIYTKSNGNVALNPHWAKYKDDPIRGPIINDLLKSTSFLSAGASSSERLTNILEGFTNRVCCDGCGQPSIFNQAKRIYPQSCQKCFNSDPQIKEQKRLKILTTMTERYGVTNPGLIPEAVEKRRTTNIEKYGAEFPLQNKTIRAKTVITQEELYGGVGLDSEHMQQKAQQSHLINYGTKCPANELSIRRLIVEKLNAEHGVNNHIQIAIKTALPMLQDAEWLKTQHYVNKIPLDAIALKLGVNQSTVQNYMHSHGLEPQRYLQSHAERELVEFLSGLGIDNIQTSNRSLIAPKELDIVLPDYKLAIEYHGLYWHSDDMPRITPKYHLAKMNSCNSVGYRLIQIFENEWMHQKDLVKSRIASILGKSSKKIYARQCTIKSISNKDKTLFLNANHIQKDCASKYNHGLYYNDELVAVMTFGASRYNKAYQYELLRYANIMNANVVGGASRLFKYFIKTESPTSVVSYSDLRWNTGKLYQLLGFGLSHQAAPSYFYFTTNEMKIYHRSHFQKHKLSQLLEHFDEELTEVENMKNNGYQRVWDCGNLVYVWTTV